MKHVETRMLTAAQEEVFERLAARAVPVVLDKTTMSIVVDDETRRKISERVRSDPEVQRRLNSVKLGEVDQDI